MFTESIPMDRLFLLLPKMDISYQCGNILSIIRHIRPNKVLDILRLLAPFGA